MKRRLLIMKLRNINISHLTAFICLLLFPLLASAASFYTTLSQSFSSSGSATTTHTFTLPANQKVASSGYVKIELTGDFDASNEYADIYIEGSYVGKATGGSATCTTNLTKNFPLSQSDLEKWGADGKIVVTVQNSSAVSGCTDSQRKHGLALSITNLVSSQPAQTLSKVRLTCPSSITEGATGSCSANADFSDGSSTAVTSSVTNWKIDKAGSISSGGVITAGQVSSDQFATITGDYTYNGKTMTGIGTTTIKDDTVSGLRAFRIVCPSTLNENSNTQCQAYATIDGTERNVNTSSTWSVNASYTSINTSGVLVSTEVASDSGSFVKASYTYGGVTKSAEQMVTIKDVPVTVPTTSKTLQFKNRWRGTLITVNGSSDWVVSSVSGGYTLCEKSRPTYCLNTENGSLQSTVISTTSTYAKWAIEDYDGHKRIRNIGYSTYYIHQENPTVTAGVIQSGWWSAQWAMTESTNTPTTVVTPSLSASSFSNRSTNQTLTANANTSWTLSKDTIYNTGGYKICETEKPIYCLNVENGTLQSSPIQTGWLSAVWMVEDAGNGYISIRNRWQQTQYIYLNNGVLVSGAISNTSAYAQWKQGTQTIADNGTHSVAPGVVTKCSGSSCAGKYPEAHCLAKKKALNMQRQNDTTVTLWLSESCQVNWATVDYTGNMHGIRLQAKIRTGDGIVETNNNYNNNSNTVSTNMVYSPNNCSVRAYGTSEYYKDLYNYIKDGEATLYEKPEPACYPCIGSECPVVRYYDSEKQMFFDIKNGEENYYNIAKKIDEKNKYISNNTYTLPPITYKMKDERVLDIYTMVLSCPDSCQKYSFYNDKEITLMPSSVQDYLFKNKEYYGGLPQDSKYRNWKYWTDNYSQYISSEYIYAFEKQVKYSQEFYSIKTALLYGDNVTSLIYDSYIDASKLTAYQLSHPEQFKEEVLDAAAITIDEMELKEEDAKLAISLAMDITPVIGTGKAISQLIYGNDLVTGTEVNRFTEVIGIIPYSKIIKKTNDVKFASKIVTIIMRNYDIGKKAEKLLEANPVLIKRFGDVVPDKTFNSSLGQRYFDVVLGTTAIESKVGRVSLTERVKSQILKDVEALQNDRVKSIVWMNTKSPITGKEGFTQSVIDFAKSELKNNGLSESLLIFEKSPLSDSSLK